MRALVPTLFVAALLALSAPGLAAEEEAAPAAPAAEEAAPAKEEPAAAPAPAAEPAPAPAPAPTPPPAGGIRGQAEVIVKRYKDVPGIESPAARKPER